MIRLARLLSLMLVAALSLACDGSPAILAPAGRDSFTASLPRATNPVFTFQRALLERVSAGLLYTSESDYPFTWYEHDAPDPAPSGALSAEEFRALLDIPPDVTVETVTLDAFFARHIERVDRADAAAVALVPRYILLRETLRRTLRYAQVYRVGQIAIDCYIVGIGVDGRLQGLTTIAIET